MRVLRQILLALVVAAASMTTFEINGAAWADGSTDCNHSDYANDCVVGAQTQPEPGHSTEAPHPVGSTGDKGPACYFDPSKQGLPGSVKAHPVPCKSPYGYWSNDNNCYIQLVKPPPAASDPAWKGHKPGDGAVYDCFQPDTQMEVYIWFANPPAGPGQQFTPEQVARMAIKKLRMNVVGVGLAPTPLESNPKSMGVIGLPVWMWVAQPTANTYGPLTASATAGGITVTARASVERVEWDMGDGSKPIICTKGTPYDPTVDKTKPSPDCGYTYSKTSAGQPNGEYTVEARSFWRVDWAGAGQQGTIRLPALVATAHIREGELQTLNKN